MTLLLVLLRDRGNEGGFLFCAPFAAFSLDRFAPHCREHRCDLLPAHYADACIRPHPEEAWTIGTPAHSVVSGAKASTDNDCQLRNAGACNGRNHLGPMPGDALVLVLFANHETGDVLQEDEWHFALTAQLNKVCALLRRLREQDAVVCNDPDKHPADTRETRDE